MAKLNAGQYQLLLEIQMYELVESYIKFHNLEPFKAVEKLQQELLNAAYEYCEEHKIDMDGDAA